MSDLEQRIHDSVHKVLDGLQDLTTLTVTTYVGDVTVAFPDGKLDLKKLQPAASALHVAAMTQISLDNDISQVKGRDELPEGIERLHTAAVQVAIEARASVVKMLVEIAKTL
ncbi:MAG: hypothetical protein ABIO70_17935 [Pseudomonadota bacterium]